MVPGASVEPGPKGRREYLAPKMRPSRSRGTAPKKQAANSTSTLKTAASETEIATVATLYVGLNPRTALESLDSGRPRIDKIVKLIKESRYAIHDLSRLQAREAGEYFRLNMPFELGIDVGCRLFHRGCRGKRCLILEAERYRYQAAISDLSNSDIAVHKNDPQTLVISVRNWLNNQVQLGAPGPSRVWGAFLEFMGDNYDVLKTRGFSDRDIEQLPVDELITSMRTWCKENTTGGGWLGRVDDSLT